MFLGEEEAEGRKVSQYFRRSAARRSERAEEGFEGRFFDEGVVERGAFWMVGLVAGLVRERRKEDERCFAVARGSLASSGDKDDVGPCEEVPAD